MPLSAVAADVPMATAGVQRDVVFSDYPPLSRSTELARRLMSPLNAMRVRRELAHSGKGLREQSIDLAHEKFAIYVPAHVPPHGYALLVFVPPWQEALVPSRWIATLERHGMIYVSAANSGNVADVLDRREPLALLAAQNIMRRYPIDPARVYIGGFSGGSRVALRVALGYPDLFRGALLDAGSDPIGNAQIPLPPAELLRQFQASTRLVYATGQHDDAGLDEDVRSRQSMQAWCVSHLDTVAMPWLAHALADPAALDRAVDVLGKPALPERDKLAACRTRIDKELTIQLQQVEGLLAGGRRDDARVLLDRIDARYGGLAAPRSIELAGKIDAPVSPQPPR
jgi:pimeloyl-ACP methyl ester carboxylesterase